MENLESKTTLTQKITAGVIGLVGLVTVATSGYGIYSLYNSQKEDIHIQSKVPGYLISSVLLLSGAAMLSMVYKTHKKDK